MKKYKIGDEVKISKKHSEMFTDGFYNANSILVTIKKLSQMYRKDYEIVWDSINELYPETKNCHLEHDPNTGKITIRSFTK